MQDNTYVNDLAYYLLNRGDHKNTYNADRALEFTNLRGQEVFIMYYLVSQNSDLNVINMLYENGTLEPLLDANKDFISQFKEKLNDKNTYMKYNAFIDKIIDMKVNEEKGVRR